MRSLDAFQGLVVFFVVFLISLVSGLFAFTIRKALGLRFSYLSNLTCRYSLI
jgi:hypothetical protein